MTTKAQAQETRNATRALAQPQHALAGKQSVCKLTNAELAALVLADVRLCDTATCEECLAVLRIAEETAQDAARETPQTQEVARETQVAPAAADLSDACPPDCAESCCRPEAFGGVDLEDLPSDEFTPEPEPDKQEATLILFTSAPTTIDLPGTHTQEQWTGRLTGADVDITVRRVSIPESMLKAQRAAYVGLDDTLVASATQWATLEKQGVWTPAPASVPAGAPAPIVPPAAADTPDAPEAPSAPVDHLIYTTAPEDCDLRRTETVNADAGLHHGRTVRLVRLDPQDVVRQTRIYVTEEGCIAIEPAEWQKYEAAELALDAYVSRLKDVVALGDAAIKTLLRTGELRFADMPAPTTTARRIQTDGAAPKAARAASPARDDKRSIAKSRGLAPNGLEWPAFVVTPGARHTGPLPESFQGIAIDYCACGAPYAKTGDAGQVGLCLTHYKERYAARVAWLAANPAPAAA